MGATIALFIFIGLNCTGLLNAKAAEFGSIDFESAKKALQNATPIIEANSEEITTNYLQKPLIVETKIAVEPPKPVAKKINKPIVKTIIENENSNLDPSVAHRFPYGYCTYYVSTKRIIPWSGNAIAWLSGAQSFGFSTGNTPAVGSILVTREGGYTGHVAFVEAVNEDQTITISEMNYAGWGKISQRTISIFYGPIMGYIY